MAVAEHCTACGTSIGLNDHFCPRCGTDQSGTSPSSVFTTAREWQALFPRLVRAAAPRYNVLRLLGQGGMAAVYLAEEPRLARHVAIKVLSPGLTTDPAMVARFEQEARTTAQLRHPNIVAVHDFGEGEGLYYFVLEYVAGRTLAQLMKDFAAPLPFEAVAHWLAQAAAALAHAHRAGIVHRDIKPANIMIDGDGNAMLTDFGIAKVTEDNRYTRTGMLIGTPSYMSPEQCSPGCAITGGSDQYSLGVVAFELLVGAPPFTGPAVSVVHAHLSVAPDHVAQRRPDCPPQLAAAIDRMLLKDPAQRYASMLSLLSESGIAPLPLDHGLRVVLGRLATPLVLNVAPPALHFDALGERVQLQAQLQDSTGNVLKGASVQWTCSPAGVVDVGQDGVVIATGPGAAEVAADCRGTRTSVPVEVRPRAAAIHIDPREHLFDRVGQRAQLTARVMDRNGNVFPQRVEWVSRRPDIVRVDASGAVEAVANGTATLIARAAGLQAAIHVSVQDRPERIIINASDVLLTSLGEECLLRADVLDTASQLRPAWTVAWESSSPAIVAVDVRGMLTARGNGRAVVTATIEQVTATVQVTVQQEATSLEVTPARVTLDALGESHPFSAVGLDRGGAPVAAPVAWTSSDPSVVTIDAAGRANARAEGEAVITARSRGLTATASVSVRQTPVSLVIDPAPIVLHSIGQSVNLQVQVRDRRGNLMSRPWNCYSDAVGVVRTTDLGILTAVSPGQAHVHVACEGLDSAVPVEVQPRAVALSISPPRIHARALGSRASLYLEAHDAGGNPMAVPAAAWSSSDPRVVTVDDSGVATVAGPGHARIRAQTAWATAEIDVTVEQEVVSLRVVPPHMLLTFVGARAAIHVTAQDANGSAAATPPEFRTSDPAVFTIDEHGRVVATGTGHAECEVQVGERSLRVPVSVVQQVATIVCRPRQLRFHALSEQKHVIASCFDDGGHPVHARVQWSSSEPAVALVDASGAVAAVGDGSAVITAQAGDKTNSVVVYVERRPGSIRIYQDVVELGGVGETEELRAVVLDGGGAALEAPIRWSTSNTRVAAVDAAGRVAAAGPGEAQITARSAGVTASVLVRVSADFTPVIPLDSPMDEAVLDSAPASSSLLRVARRVAPVVGGMALIFAIMLTAWRIPVEPESAAVQNAGPAPAMDSPPHDPGPTEPVAHEPPDSMVAVAPAPPAQQVPTLPRQSTQQPATSSPSPTNEPPDPHLEPELANRAVAQFLTVLMNDIRGGRAPEAEVLTRSAAADVQHLLSAVVSAELSWEFISQPSFRSRDRAEATISVELGPDQTGLRRPPERLRAIVVRTADGFRLESLGRPS
jgi:uncharacterized protein YjdB